MHVDGGLTIPRYTPGFAENGVLGTDPNFQQPTENGVAGTDPISKNFSSAL